MLSLQRVSGTTGGLSSYVWLDQANKRVSPICESLESAWVWYVKTLIEKPHYASEDRRRSGLDRRSGRDRRDRFSYIDRRTSVGRRGVDQLRRFSTLDQMDVNPTMTLEQLYAHYQTRGLIESRDNGAES